MTEPAWSTASVTPIVVRYSECDPMRVAHHAAYVVWLEQARTDRLRKFGTAYRELEEMGIYFVVARLNIRYQKPARYDDHLEVHTAVVAAGRVKIDHEYRIYRGKELLTTADTTIVCVDHDGKLQPVPDTLLADAPQA